MSDETARLMNRFVRPIYDAIDNRQYKTAIKHCLHKKVAHLDIVLVLKAHCLERTGKTDEALEICRLVQKRKPTDDTLLNTMNLVFKLAGCEHEMLPSFEYACAHAEPPSEELFASLFFAYARRGEFLKQQQTALKMFKAFGGVKYMSWASLSMMLQVQHGGAPAKMLALAERMQLKTLRDLKSDDGEALQLLVLIMQLQEKHEDALAAFDEFAKPLAGDGSAAAATNKHQHCGDTDCTDSHSPKGRSAEGEGTYEEDIELGPMLAIDRLTLEASLAKTVANWERAAAVYQTLLEQHNGDDWTFLKEFIAVRFELDDDLASVEHGVRDFLAQLQGRAGNELLRGPRLAVIHLLSEKLARLHAAQAPEDALAKVETQLEEQIVLYIDRFFTKTCCFTDLQQYLALFLVGDSSSSSSSRVSVSSAARARLVDRIAEMSAESVSVKSNEDEGDRKEALGKLNRRLLALKTLRFLGYYDDAAKFPVAELEKLAQALVDEYEATGWLNVGSTGGQREVQNTDNLLLLAAHFLIDAYQRAPGHRELLVRAAALLEYGLEKSAYNFQMKLLLSRVYGYLGAGEAMLTRHAELDVKHVQLDSLSFLVLDKMLQLCHFAEARHLTNSIERMHRGTVHDTPEYIARSYKTGVYSKVIDMTSFLYKKMQKSHTLAISKSEALLFGLFDAAASGPSKLHDHVASSAFEKKVSSLEAMLASADELSRNQHREVIVQWTPHAAVAAGDAFADDGSKLVECDRSANFASSVLWLKLRVAIAKMLHSVALGENDALASLETEYAGYLTQLELTPSQDAESPASLHQQVWQWSAETVRAAVTLISGESGESAFAELQTSFVAIVQQLPDALVFKAAGEKKDGDAALSPYGVSTLSLLLGECGLWTLCLLSAALRIANKKKSKKDDQFAASVSALRALLKQLQESYATLETQIGALRFGDAKQANGSAGEGKTDLAAAERKAAANVRASYATLQSRLKLLLHDRVSTIRLVLQQK